MENDIELSRRPLVSIGEKLKKAREGKKVSIDQVQKQTRIYSTILIALEEGRCDEILPLTYVKSFLKKYSNHLGLNSDELLKEYLAIHPESNLSKSTMNIKGMETAGTDIFSKFIYIISLVLLIIASLALITFLGKKVVTTFKRPKKAIKQTLSVAKRKALVPAKVTVEKKAAIKKEVPSEVAIPKEVPLNLVLKVKETTLIGVKKDGVLLFKRSMPKGSLESFTADERLEIYVAKAEAIELTLNGKPLGSPGKGVIRELEITRKGVRIK